MRKNSLKQRLMFIHFVCIGHGLNHRWNKKLEKFLAKKRAGNGNDFCRLNDIRWTVVQIDALVLRYGDNLIAIRTVFDAPHLVGMLVEGVHAFPFSEIPNLHGFIAARRCKMFTVARERYAQYPGCVSRKRARYIRMSSEMDEENWNRCLLAASIVYLHIVQFHVSVIGGC